MARRSHLSVSCKGSSTTQGAILGLDVGWGLVLVGESEFLCLFVLFARLLMMAVPPFLKDWVTDSRSELGNTGRGGELGSTLGGGGSDQVFLSLGDRDFLLSGVTLGNCSSRGIFITLLLADAFFDRLVLWHVTSLSSSWILGKF